MFREDGEEKSISVWGVIKAPELVIVPWKYLFELGLYYLPNKAFIFIIFIILNPEMSG